MKWTMICLLAIFAASAGCKSTDSTKPKRDISDAVASLTRTVCFGTCPAYTLTIKGTGEVIFDGIKHVEKEGIHRTTIPVDSVDALLEYAENIGYFSMLDSYQEMSMSDAPSALTSISFGKKNKKIRHYLGDMNAPGLLRELESRFDEIANVQQWTMPAKQ